MRGGARILAARAEIGVSLAFLGGWALVTAGVAACSTPKVWWFSAGFLLLSLCGWRFLGEIAWKGLYALTREERRRG